MTTPRPCPVCGRPAQEKTRPFCSDRCRQIDLGRWLSESYAIPADPDSADEPPTEEERPQGRA